MSENNDTSNESNSLGSDSILQASRLTGGGGGGGSGSNSIIRSGVLRPSVLGPSVLGSALNSSSGAAKSNDAKTKVDDAAVIVNPFMKEQNDEKDKAEHQQKEERGKKENKDLLESDSSAFGAVGGTDSVKNNDTNAKKTKSAHDEDVEDERPDPLTMLRKNGLERSNLFAGAKNSIPRVEKYGFVFGQNVHERVVGENINPETAGKMENSNNGTASGELLFSSVIQNAANKANECDGMASSSSSTSSAATNAAGAATKETETKSLTDVAREYEESRAQKRKYEEVETFTGEENEINIVDVSCKLFAFVNSNWEERGRGSLRVNDSKNEQECSRVVFRTSGNLLLLLNTKVWAGMVAERPSQKSLRLTAMDNTGKLKIFLAMARPVDINQLHKALVERIDLRKISHPEECRTAAVTDDISENNGGVEAKNGSAEIINHVEDDEEVDDDEELMEDEEGKGKEKQNTAEATAVTKTETETAAVVADTTTEPSPKKPLIAETAN